MKVWFFCFRWNYQKFSIKNPILLKQHQVNIEVLLIKIDNARSFFSYIGNKVCRRSIMCGSQNIVLQGKTIVMADCIVRGDLAAVKIGKNCVIGEKCVIRPPFKKFAKGVAFFPMQIGDHVFIEDECVINAASIGSYVHIGKNSVIGRRCIIMDCSYILPNSVIPPETVIPPFSEFIE